MGLLARLIGALRAKAADDSPDAQFFPWGGFSQTTAAGERVTPDRAMRTAAVWACVRVRSEDIGKLPLILYKRQKDGGKERAPEHPLFSLIRDQPNPRMTAMEFRQLMQAQCDLRGNGYAYKEIDARGSVVALWPLESSKVQVLRSKDGRELFYRCELTDGIQEIVPAEVILHLRGMTIDGCVGLSPIAYHRETIGMAIAAEKYGAAFFGNNAQPMGGIEVDSVLSAEARSALRASWKDRHLGKREIGIFDGGMKWVATGMTNDDAQYVEARGMSNRDIWRIYRVPPHKVGDLENATFSNIEQQALEYVTDCLMSEMVRWEQTLNRDLLTEEEKGVYFFEFMADALLRGDLASRYAAYAIARNWGILSVNDIRDRENLNRVKDGDIYLQPLNMIEAGSPPVPPVPTAAPPPTKEIAMRLIAYANEIIAREEPSAHAS